jgi:CIC family chloride channel protein
LVAVSFVKLLYWLEDVFDAMPIYPPLKSVIGGGIIGIIALGFPQVLGVGYETINEALSGNIVLWLLIVLIAAKIFAVSITLGSGGSGGIFAPSLFIGAMTGGAIGGLVNSVWPGAVASPGAYALVGMAAVVAASTHAPITAILIVFELTNDYKIILPLMISCIIATVLATRLQDGSIYTLKLLRRGIDIQRGHSVDVLRDQKVGDIMRADFTSVPMETSLISVISRFMEQPGSTLFVIDGNKRFRGLIRLDDIRPVITQAGILDNLLIARDLMVESGFPTFHPEDSLADVMRRLAGHVHEAPVIRNEEVVGSVWPDDLISRYNAEIFKRDTAAGLATSINGGVTTQAIPGVSGMGLAEIRVPSRFIGSSIGELNVRKRFGISILMVKQKTGTREDLVEVVPSADTVFKEGDIVVAMGLREDLLRFERI